VLGTEIAASLRSTPTNREAMMKAMSNTQQTNEQAAGETRHDGARTVAPKSGRERRASTPRVTQPRGRAAAIVPALL